MRTWLSIIVMILCTFAVRVLPLTLIRKPIKNRFIRSFLFYVPYVTLAVMTVPAIIEVTKSPISGMVALLVAILAAWRGMGLLKVTACSCAVVLILELCL